MNKSEFSLIALFQYEFQLCLGSTIVLTVFFQSCSNFLVRTPSLQGWNLGGQKILVGQKI